MSKLNPALVDVNRKNREFWAHQKVLMDRRMADRALLETAVDMIASESKRHVPIRNQLLFEQALADAEAAKQRIVTQLARKGGQSSKADPLQQLIEAIVREKRNIKCNDLLNELRKQADGTVIEELDESYVYFRGGRKSDGTAGDVSMTDVDRKVTSVRTPLRALKHRLTRARKKLRRK